MFRSDSTPRALRGVALAALLATIPVTPAHAQFGKLIKKAAQGAVQGAAQGAAKNAAQNATGNASNATPKADDGAVAITAQSLDALLAALGPSVKAAQDFDARRARYEQQHARFQAHQTCRDSIKKAHPMPMAPTAAMLEAQQQYAQRAGALSQRLMAASQAGDTARTRAITDTVSMLGEQSENVYLPALKTCGAYVAPPTERPVRGGFRASAPTIPAGMTATQFGRLRERVAAWLLTNGTYTVSADEQAALTARKADLDTLTPLFRGNTLTWSSWGDLH
jgi:hypothetical protein